MRSYIVVCLMALAIASVGTAEEKKANCKLTIQTSYKDGKKKVDVEEVYTVNRDECRKLAKDKQKVDNPSDGTKISTRFSWHETE